MLLGAPVGGPSPFLVGVPLVCLAPSRVKNPPRGYNGYPAPMADLEHLSEVAVALRRLDAARVEQQRCVDDLITQARKDGASRTEIMGATGYAPRSLQLALRRIEARQA